MNANELKEELKKAIIKTVDQYYIDNKHSMDAGRYGVLREYFDGIEQNIRLGWFSIRKTEYNCRKITWCKKFDVRPLTQMIELVETLIAQCKQQSGRRPSKLAKELQNTLDSHITCESLKKVIQSTEATPISSGPSRTQRSVFSTYLTPSRPQRSVSYSAPITNKEALMDSAFEAKDADRSTSDEGMMMTEPSYYGDRMTHLMATGPTSPMGGMHPAALMNPTVSIFRAAQPAAVPSPPGYRSAYGSPAHLDTGPAAGVMWLPVSLPPPQGLRRTGSSYSMPDPVSSPMHW